MDEQASNPTTNLNNTEVPSTLDVTNGCIDKNSISAKSVEKKIQKEEEIKKKTVPAENKTSESNAIEKKTEDNPTPTTDCGNSNDSGHKDLRGRGLKRKVNTEKQSENGTKQETENNKSAENKNTKNLEEKNDGSKSPKRKTARKESENTAYKKMEDNPNTNAGNTGRNVIKNKNGRIKKSTSNAAVHPPISVMVLDSFRNLRKRNGMSTREISKYVAENYEVNINRIKPNLKTFLQKGVEDGLFVQVSSSGIERKYKIRRTEKTDKRPLKVKKVPGKLDVTMKSNGNVAKVTSKIKKKTEKAEKVTRKMMKETGKAKKITKNSKNSKKPRPARKMSAQR